MDANEDQDGGVPKSTYSHGRAASTGGASKASSTKAKTVTNAEKYKYFRYHFPQELVRIAPKFNVKGLSNKEIVEAEIAIYHKVSHITDALLHEDGSAIFYAVEIEWVYQWRDFCQNNGKRPGPITNSPLMNLIAKKREEKKYPWHDSNIDVVDLKQMFTVSGAFWNFLLEHYGCDVTIEMHRFLTIEKVVPSI